MWLGGITSVVPRASSEGDGMIGVDSLAIFGGGGVSEISYFLLDLARDSEVDNRGFGREEGFGLPFPGD
jgi:hypothetical protein